MDYKEKFEDFLNRMTGLLDNARKQGHIIVRVEDLENAFPELKESEDERIRKFLLYHFGNKTKKEWNGMPVKDILAWLEKQRKKDEEILVLKDQIESLHAAIKATKNIHKIELEKLGFTTQSDDDKSEQKPADKPKPKFKVGDSIKTANEEPLTITEISDRGYWSEDLFICGFDDAAKWELVEQKPANNVKSKFKTEDWVVYDGWTCQITDVKEDGYCNDHNGFISKDREDDMRLWTVQDAKDGDVLAVEPIEGYSSSFVAICKKQNEEDFVSYCFVGFDGKFYEGEHGHTTKNIHPATKEQRDLLFQKIHEAGYEWDAEKKELKKIEPFDKYEGLTDFERTLTDICIGWIGEELGWKQYIKDNADVLLKIAIKKFNSVQDAPFEQKHAEWSEEDERMHRGIHNLIYSTPYCDSRKELSEWLESLKNRVQPQQNQGWSEEDENAIQVLKGIVKHSNKINEIIYTIPLKEKLYDYLKSLKERALPQPKQEWSKEDEKCLRLSTDIIDSALRAGFCVQLDRDRCVDWLKSLKPQNRWKPSDEQMNAFDAVLVYNPPCSDKCRSNLITLFEQLKKLREG